MKPKFRAWDKEEKKMIYPDDSYGDHFGEKTSILITLIGGAMNEASDEFQERFEPGVVHQLGRAHGCASGAGWQDTLAQAAKEKSVNQLGFATRKLGDEGDIEFVVAQGGLDSIESLFQLCVTQILILQPVTQVTDTLEQVGSPPPIILKMFFDALGCH